ncbi:881_t:CDS:2 [Paraglomus occultum]|uniref:5-methyltetrahydropteroyltriglutamate--homocysteine S-methyltransferase n=1 Tax=Paraglomus occultum TaxID=144539 RepID=A0A9N8ZIB7_9GLOM|nr:881_t:CDS:2 [Paraglomus occultum]
MSTRSAILGFPRMGANRELKRLVESFWSDNITESTLLEGIRELRKDHWVLQKELGLNIIPSNDFSLYDHVLDHAFMVGAIPKRYRDVFIKDENELPSTLEGDALSTYFAMARGYQKFNEGSDAPAIDLPAMEMKKWFDTNYHFIVPEFEPTQQFKLTSTKFLEEYKQAKSLGIETRPVFIGPVSLLLLGKASSNAQVGFAPIQLLDRLLPVYEEIVRLLAEAGASSLQFDESFLVMDLDPKLAQSYLTAYSRLSKVAEGSIKIQLTTYFGDITPNLSFIFPNLPISGLHIDLVRAPQQFDTILNAVAKHPTLQLSIGVIDGRNIWKRDLRAAFDIVSKAITTLGADRVIIASSCSLLHTPHSLAAEVELAPEIKDWLAFSVEKIKELVLLAKAANDGIDSIQAELEANQVSIQNRRTSPKIHNPVVQERLKGVTRDMMRRSPFSERKVKQHERLKLPRFPTTTIGSFPQTAEVRKARAAFRSGQLSKEQYDEFIKDEIKKCIRFQEECGIDVLVHGEFERTDMVEYFGEHMDGYVFTKNGWVQSYGSRCVKPPIIYGDIHLPKPITVDITKYAQLLTKKPLKGMLTGPVTMLQWSFVRDDQPRKLTTQQLALAIRDEVTNLETAGISIIQIDEPALREGLPLRRGEWQEYLEWAVDWSVFQYHGIRKSLVTIYSTQSSYLYYPFSFLLASSPVADTTQIHTHMCYSDFQDIIGAISRMDADVITIENSRSDLKFLHAESFAYPNEIGPGIYDIHSPRIPQQDEMKHRLKEMLRYLKREDTWVNPDCGLKTRQWKEVELALKNMTEVARSCRENVKLVSAV